MSDKNASPSPFAQTFYHGTKASLKIGDVIRVGFNSNYGQPGQLNHVYMTATLDAAIWGAELASGNGRERIYLVEPTGDIEYDPNLTNKKFPGNPTMAYRSLKPLRVVGEVATWQGHTPAQLKTMKDGLVSLKGQGADKIEH